MTLLKELTGRNSGRCVSGHALVSFDHAPITSFFFFLFHAFLFFTFGVSFLLHIPLYSTHFVFTPPMVCRKLLTISVLKCSFYILCRVDMRTAGGIFFDPSQVPIPPNSITMSEGEENWYFFLHPRRLVSLSGKQPAACILISLLSLPSHGWSSRETLRLLYYFGPLLRLRYV